MTYTSGLRIGKAVNLQAGALDFQRMMVHVHRGKGAKDRYVPLPRITLAARREFWKSHRNPKFLFPAENPEKARLTKATEDKS